jgi:hypothetical protein
MKRIGLFEEFLNRREELSFWRTTSPKFLESLLHDRKVKSKGKKFISLSEDEHSGSQDSFGEITIEFDGEKILKQGGIYVDYEDPEFWNRHPDIALHVTGFSDAEEYYDNYDFDSAEDANKKGELTWEQTCETYANEEEIVIPEIKMEKDLIKSVSSTKQFSSNIMKMLKSENIEFKLEN